MTECSGECRQHPLGRRPPWACFDELLRIMEEEACLRRAVERLGLLRRQDAKHAFELVERGWHLAGAPPFLYDHLGPSDRHPLGLRDVVQLEPLIVVLMMAW